MDFGFAHYFPKHLRLEESIIEPFSNGREQRLPEAGQHEIYAADVYRAARLFYGWFAVSDLPLSRPEIQIAGRRGVICDVPGFLDLLRDMTIINNQFNALKHSLVL